jgi:signal transduction histidine kinase
MLPFAVANYVREALELNPVPDKVRVTLDFPPDLPAALADPDQVRIVLGNLIRNAREAMADGGELRITSRAVGDAVEIAVADTGVGIPPDQLHRVTEPLYSTKARGLGLGLAIARAILDKNQGSLHVASVPGAGSTFTVRLSAVAPQRLAQ